MKQVAMYHLKEATYLQDLETGLTLENIVDAEIMTFFETDIKRSFKLSQTNSTFTFRLRGLQKSDTNPRIWNNALVLSYQDMLAIFQQSLDTIKDLMNSQITHALDNDILVHRVVLLGGYGDSPALKELLTASLSATNNARGTNIVLVTTAVNTAAGAVATGGIIRAQDKDNGPKRVPRQSIGIKRHYPDEPVTYTRDVLSQGWERNKTNGYWYTRNTIEGDVKAVSCSSHPTTPHETNSLKGEGELQPVHSINFKSQHEFKPENKKWIPKENLFASDTCTPDFYTRQHVKNRGQTAEIGSVQFDITHLKDKIEMQAAPYMRTKWYEVELLIETKVIDRNLAFTALACQRPERCCDSRQPGLLQLGVGFRSQKPPEALQALVSGIF
jgi:hypothetical protein